MEKVNLYIPNISCHHCINTITKELKALDGIKSVNGDVTLKTIEVEFEAPANIDKVRSLLKEIGYPAN